MADPTTPTGSVGFNTNPNAITEAGWQIITAERDDLKQKRDSADCELMYQYYNALMRITNHFYLKAQKANVILEAKADRQAARSRHEQLKQGPAGQASNG